MTSQQNVSKSSRPISFVGMNIHQIKSELNAQLDNQEQLLEKSASPISRNAIIKQTGVLRKELKGLNKYNQQDEIPEELRLKLETLANEFQQIKTTKALSNPDINFATEIGQGLLIEVRKLQSAIQEKEEIIKRLEASRAENERHYETSQRHLRQREEVEERLKEENWNLEVANQELLNHLSESNQTIAKHNTDYARMIKQVKNQSEQMEIMKAQEEKTKLTIEAMKARHEQETHQLRKHVANTQRDNAQLQKQIEALNTELKICKAKLTIKLAATLTRSEEGEPLVNAEALSSSDQTPSQTQTPVTQRGTGAMETETLKQSLAHAHRIISNLRSSAHKEKMEKFELKKMLSDSQETIEQLRREMSNRSASLGPKSVKKKQTKKRRTGVARQARGVSLSSSDDQSIKSSDSEESLDEVLTDPQFQGLGFGFGTPMKPLSSELEFKVQVIDVGINTDPVDVVVHPKPEHGLSSFTLTEHSIEPSVVQTEADSKENADLSPEQSIKAVVDKEIQSIYVKLTSLLPPQQMEMLVGKDLFTINHLTETHSNQSVDTNTISREEASQWVETAVQEALERCRSEAEQTMMSRAKVNQAIEAALEEERRVRSDSMVAKTVVDQWIAEAVEKAVGAERESMLRSTLPKEEVEERMKTMVPKSRVDELVDQVEKAVAAKEEIENTMKGMVPKSQVDELVAKLERAAVEKEEILRDTAAKEEVERMTKEMVPKTRMEEAVAEVKRAASAEREAILKNTIAKEEVEEMMKTMVPKSHVDRLLAEAAEKTAQAEKDSASPMDQVARSEVDRLVTEAMQKGIEIGKETALVAREEEMVSKSEVDRLITEAAQNAIAFESERLFLTMIPKEEAEKRVMEASAAAVEKTRLEMEQKMEQEMVSKQEAEKRVIEATSQVKQQMEQEMIPKSDVEIMMEQVKEKAQAEFSSKLRQAEEEAIKDMLTKEEVHAAALEAAEKACLGMITKDDAQELIAQAIAKEHETMREQHQQALEKALLEAKASKDAEKEELNKCIESYKKESEEINLRMKSMLTKESTDVLIKRAVADVLKASEMKQQEIFASMVSKVDAEMMREQAVARALEQERKKVAEREAAEAVEMISKVEAEALAKVAAADAIVKERQAQAAREQELISKDEADNLVQQAVHEAVEKEKIKHAETLAKERKAMKEKEEKFVAKEQAEAMAAEAVRIALKKERESEAEKAEKINTPTFSDRQQDSQPSPIVPERSISTSRLVPPSVQVIPSPSISTPPTTSKSKLRLTSSMSSLRRKASSDNNKKDNKKSSTENHRGFGTLRILENTTYGSRRIGSKASLKSISKQGSTTSLSTMATEETHHYSSTNHHHEDNMSMFADSEGNTDMDVISSITQTMIGEWMMKHTRRYVGSGISEHKHKRFFWIHPYTKSLYWSSIEPGVDGSESRAKSAFIESVIVVSNQNQQEGSPMSLLIRTPKRDIKITAPSLERHEIWHKSMMFLAGRSSQAQHSSEELPAEEAQQDATTQSIKNMIPAQEVAQYDSDDSEEMINLRQCCDGKHDLSTLSKKHSHTHL
ncbi:hypothetical protein G6F46_007849 [Rhizopus delemar]|uniref:Pleckstrin homology domain-containing protein n=2 Tax=Rhizopus TaxID=4842 RepID=A0A9P7CPD7_9FUNG|nr:hypothetical protein G6F55_006700 [Rhizopus delemar]KAG1544902.1 hypothetical protein G6F51_005780 [Rhizopus arrhizus]KAG1525671.1 hypothetical protein G6F52_003118 [Rhizopus delemar]KAG1555072.1 hypothetical protein G6F49_007479 [Rhizopus delemar]KAG1569670.1 hypothetical protein G6F50_006166 [Rhizopus delemar]